MYRLVAYSPDGVRRFPLHKSPLVLGSEAGCDVQLPYTGVARRHARLTLDDGDLHIEDLGSRKGVLVAGEKVREARFDVLDEVRLGSVTLLVEDVVPEAAPEPAAAVPPPAVPRLGAEGMIDHLVRVTEWVLTDVESRRTAESMVGDLLRDFGGGVLLLLHGDLDETGVKLLVASEESWLASGERLIEQVRRHVAAERAAANPSLGGPGTGGALVGTLAGEETWICYQFFVAVERAYVQVVAVPRFRPDGWSPVASLRALGDLLILGLVHHVGWYEPILPGHQGRQGLVLDSGLVVGESPAMQRVVEQIRAAVEPPVHVLLRGEPGVGKEALARSIHLSSSRRNGPLVHATCAGASPAHVEADLFGAEVPGKSGPVRREGKLLLAHGGTLYLDDVEALPLELQARLVRFLRSGDVEPAGSREARQVDVRIVAASRQALEPLARRDLFRVDLAYRLSQFAIDVPALRDRKEDLTLLVQSYINRFCHETGKRMAGITVKAMSALLAYDYPGNLGELENAVRQMVHMTPNGRPIDVETLPEPVRLSNVRTGAKVDAGSDLDLERLVAATEESAIREGLKRTQGNKTQAAKLLGLSRNGLAMKMERFGVEG
jgi:transcriptional regulator with AAA-type ATPase domain